MSKPIVQNKKAHFNYEMIDKYSAGVELSGGEVKSLKGGHGSLDGAYVIIRGGEAYLENCTIPPYQVNNTRETYEPMRERKLLLTKKEIRELGVLENGKGLTIVALAFYNNKKRVKLEIATARGKREFDKRETIKKREVDKESRRTLKYE